MQINFKKGNEMKKEEAKRLDKVFNYLTMYANGIKLEGYCEDEIYPIVNLQDLLDFLADKDITIREHKTKSEYRIENKLLKKKVSELEKYIVNLFNAGQVLLVADGSATITFKNLSKESFKPIIEIESTEQLLKAIADKKDIYLFQNGKHTKIF